MKNADDHKDLEELFGAMVRAMVNGRVETSHVAADDSVTFTIVVEDNELGCLIGKQGRVVRSLRTLLVAIGKVRKQGFALVVERQSAKTGRSGNLA